MAEAAVETLTFATTRALQWATLLRTVLRSVLQSAGREECHLLPFWTVLP
jgi:hypothetical protein